MLVSDSSYSKRTYSLIGSETIRARRTSTPRPVTSRMSWVHGRNISRTIMSSRPSVCQATNMGSVRMYPSRISRCTADRLHPSKRARIGASTGFLTDGAAAAAHPRQELEHPAREFDHRLVLRNVELGQPLRVGDLPGLEQIRVPLLVVVQRRTIIVSAVRIFPQEPQCHDVPPR